MVTCIGLNNCKKAEVNGEEEEEILKIIHVENIPNWDQLKPTSSWINIDLTHYFVIQTAGSISFSLLTETIHHIIKFDIELKNRKGELLNFDEQEKKSTSNKFFNRRNQWIIEGQTIYSLP